MLDFNNIYHHHKDLVYNLCLHYLLSKEEAEDAMQEIFLKIHAKKDAFKADSTWKTWVYRISVNYCLDVLKAKQRKAKWGQIIDFFSKEVENSFKEMEHPGIVLEKKEEVSELLFLINKLAPNQKSVLILTQLEEKTHAEVAEIMEISTKAVESMLARAKKNLKKLYKERGEEGDLSSN